MPTQSLFKAQSLARRYPICVLLTELAFVSFALFLAGCATSRVDDPAPKRAEGPAAEDVELRLRTEYERWRGTPHVLGGTSSRGLDCSAFVQRVYADAFDMHLPRTTEAQVQVGRKISTRDLEPGDLVFFRPSKTRHVGIYLSNGDFAHVSSSDGVTISQLDLPYWKDAYWTSRRILPDQTAVRMQQGREIEVRDVAETTTSGRVGW